MENKPPYSKRRKTLTWVIVFLSACILLITLVCIYISQRLPFHGTRAPRQFPTGEIVFSAGMKLGFIDADGSHLVKIPFAHEAENLYTFWDQPMITADGQALVVVDRHATFDMKSLFVARAGEFAVDCGKWGYIRFVQLASDPAYVLIQPHSADQGIAMYSLEDCGTDRAPVKVYDGIFGVLSPDGQYAAEVRREDEPPHMPWIIIRQIATGSETTFGPGDFPAWSRDSQWLAFTGKDGIYIVGLSDLAGSRRVVDFHKPGATNPIYQFNPVYRFHPPMAYWSPDGQWLVYHVYHESPLMSWNEGDPNYSIFKVNIVTEEETKLVDGGSSPFWRWPAQP